MHMETCEMYGDHIHVEKADKSQILHKTKTELDDVHNDTFKSLHSTTKGFPIKTCVDYHGFDLIQWNLTTADTLLPIRF